MVEVYQNTELNDICFETESLEEWNKINKELGMSKQLEFTKRAESPNPYPFMNNSMTRIFEVLCPTKVECKLYDKTPIPLEVLKQLQYSIGENHFQKYEIWYDDKSPDPLLVGISAKYYGKYTLNGSKLDIRDEKQNYIYFDSPEECEIYCISKQLEFDSVQLNTWGTDYKKYLIARWADVIRPINELKQLAKERIIEQYGSEIRIAIENATNALKLLQDNSNLYLSGEISEGKLKGTSNW